MAVAVVVCGILGKDKWYNIAYSALAIVYLLLLTDGKKLGYVLCCVFAAGYAAIAFYNGFYATATFHAAVLLPTSVYRICVLNRKKKEAEKIRNLSVKAWLAAVLGGAAVSVGLYFLLRAVKDAQPLLDGVILALSLLTSLMMLRNCREMWWFNLMSSVLYVVMWTVQFCTDGTGLAFAVMQAVVSGINVKGIVDWYKREKQEKESASQAESTVASDDMGEK